MGEIFSRPKSIRIAPPRPVAPPPTETVGQAGEQVRRQPPSGRAATFLTGDLVPEQKKKTVLG